MPREVGNEICNCVFNVPVLRDDFGVGVFRGGRFESWFWGIGKELVMLHKGIKRDHEGKIVEEGDGEGARGGGGEGGGVCVGEGGAEHCLLFSLVFWP